MFYFVKLPDDAGSIASSDDSDQTASVGSLIWVYTVYKILVKVIEKQ